MRDFSTLSGLAAACSLLLFILGAGLLEHTLVRLDANRHLVARTVAVLDRARTVGVDVVNAETGQRGYLLTGEARYLAPYRIAVGRVWPDFDDLESRVTLSEQQVRLRRLRPLIVAKLAELAETIRLRDRSFEAALAVVSTDEGQRLVEQIRGELGDFEATARRFLQDRADSQEQTARTSTYLAVGCGSLALLGAALSTLSVLRRRDNRHLIEQNEHLERIVAERTASLEELNAELEGFAATVSHDLRAPAQVIGGYAQALREDTADRLRPEELGFLDRIANAAERMEQLVDDILSYSRLAREHLQLGPVPLEAVVDTAILLNRETIDRSRAEVRVARPLPAVRGHQAALEAAIGNLLSNALKFTRPGVPPSVRISAERLGSNGVRIWMVDNGIGVLPADQERIFRPFERLHGQESYAGTGLGLAIVRKTAERMGGGAGVSSDSSGSRFWIDLRLAA